MVPTVCVAGSPRLVCFAVTYREQVMFEIHSQSCLLCVHSEGIIWTKVLYSSAVPECVSCWSSTHTCSASSTYSSRRRIQASHCCHGDHFDPVSTSSVNCPLPSFTVFLSVHPSSFHFIRRWKRKNPTLHSREAWLFLLLFSLSDSFTHSVWHQQSPLLPLSLPLHTAFISMCVYTCSFHRLREGSLWGENEGSASAADFSHTGRAKRW